MRKYELYPEAKRIYKRLKGNFDVLSLVKYLESIGYSVVFFNTAEGDQLLQAYGICPQDVKAFTYCGSTRIVFVDNQLHTTDKIYSLLHEIGHITLKHIGNGNIDMYNKRTTENEAEAFTYKVLNYNKTTKKQNVTLFIVCSTILMLFQGGLMYHRLRKKGDIDNV